MEQKTVLHNIWTVAGSSPHKLCVYDRHQSMTYGQYKKAVCRCRIYLKNIGVKKGDRVAIVAEQNVIFLLMVSAVHLAGAVAIPLERNLPEKRIKDILPQFKTIWLVCRQDMDISGIRAIHIPESILKATEPDKDVEYRLPDPESLADILFTTGTTGNPKGIEISHLANRAIAENVIDSVGLREDDVELIPTPINHSLGLRRYYGAMYRGSAVGIVDGVIYMEDFFAMAEQYHVTAITLVPAMLSILLKFSKDRLKMLNRQLRFVQLGSAHATKSDKEELCRLLPDVRLYNTYGATEAGCSCILDFNKLRDKVFCIGRPTVNTTVSFVDEEGNPLKTSENCVGYMVLEGPMVMNGYWREPELTAKVLREGKIYTNDVGYLGEDGYIYLLGRKDDVINSGGNKIAPLEVEEMMMKFHKVAECACVPVWDLVAGQVPKLFVVMNPGEMFAPQEILSFLAERMEPFKVPKYIELLEKLPRAYNGKILRKVLREREEEHHEC